MLSIIDQLGLFVNVSIAINWMNN